MKDKEKQIEEIEMAREIHKALLNCHNNYNCHKCEFRHDTPMSFCKAEYIAKAISGLYQPKIDKDSVVLTKEEYIDLKFTKNLLELREETIKYLEDANIRYAKELELKVNKKERKETAEKVIKWFKKNSVCIPDDNDINEFAKQFGVDIKE